jgi:hypothetical protein
MGDCLCIITREYGKGYTRLDWLLDIYMQWLTLVGVFSSLYRGGIPLSRGLEFSSACGSIRVLKCYISSPRDQFSTRMKGGDEYHTHRISVEPRILP